MSFVRIVTSDEQLPTPPETPALTTGYTPDRFQAFAIQAIEAGENVLVTAKTGSGKTFVGEYQIAKSLQRGGRVFYTTPVKSLSNQKFNDLKKLFPSASVGIMTGDIKFRPDAQIIVMTTEILRNLLFKKGTLTENIGLTSVLSLNDLDSVIFDEVHYINDHDRGHVWEECLILLPPSVKLILLSATLSSPFGFAKWLGECKKVRVWLISTLWRAVPLEHSVVHGASLKTFYDNKEQYHEDVYRSYLADHSASLLAHDKFKDKVKAAIASGKEGPVAGKTRPKSFEHHLNACLGNLNEQGNLPAIVFVFSRAGCEKLAKRVDHTFIDSSDAAAVSHIWDFHLSRYKDSLEFSPQAHALKELAMRGIAYHHSGLLPFLKEILEILFSRGLCKVLFATETFAVGINMPTKTVIFTALEKFSDGGERLLKTSEYIQMAGRAGRRGKDERGLVIYLPQREPISASELKAIVCGKSASFGSQMNFHYDFLLKILNASSSSITENELIQKSYWFALEQEGLEGMKKEYQELVSSASNIHLKPEEREECELYYDIQCRISENQNSKKKAAQRELVVWKDSHKESLWNPILSRYEMRIQIEKKMETLDKDIRMATDASTSCNIPIVQKRRLLLEEYGFLEDGLRLTPYGRLSSEINEGHPFLMVELYIQQTTTLSPLSVKELLTVLSLFIDGGEFVLSLDVSKGVVEVLSHLNRTATSIVELEHKYRIPYDNQFWSLSTEWVEPVAEWLEGAVSVAELAMKYELFEGNVQKALMKLSALLEEFQALATMSGNVDMLDKLAEARPLVLRDLVLAESLYLRV